MEETDIIICLKKRNKKVKRLSRKLPWGWKKLDFFMDLIVYAMI